jgi:hypothetical protein
MTEPEEVEYDRPDCVPVDWLLCTRGFALDGPVPDRFMDDRALESEEPWDRLFAMAVRAQAGDFAPMSGALDIACTYKDWHLRDSALRLFAQSAPNDERSQLATLFEHPDTELRMESWGMVPLSCDLSLAAPLAAQRRACPEELRTRITVPLSNLLGDESDDLLFVDTGAGDVEFEGRIRSLVDRIGFGHGEVPAIYAGAPLDLFTAAARVRTLCQEDDPADYGGSMSDAMDVVEAMTGLFTDGCFDEECAPDVPRVLDVLNQLRQEPRFGGFVTGERYFFGHRIR